MKKYYYYLIRINIIEGIFDTYEEALNCYKYLINNGYDYGLEIIKGKKIEVKDE